ncbi:hypothetical protein D3C73_793370 [compost metagenome]
MGETAEPHFDHHIADHAVGDDDLFRQDGAAMRRAGVYGRRLQHGPSQGGDGLAQTPLDVVMRRLQLA